MKRYIKTNSDAEYKRLWTEVCQAYADRIGAELLFVNSDNFGIETKDGELLHIYADELERILRSGR